MKFNNELVFYQYKKILDYLKETEQIGNYIYKDLLKKYDRQFKPKLWEFY